MQLFSRKKALLTVSLAALGGLAACGDNVTVPPTVAASVQVFISPNNASANIGDVLTFSVQITGGSTTTPPTLASCTSSNSAVATAVVNGTSCKVTAVGSGNASITAAATGGQQASAAVSVTAQTPSISNLTLSPTAANLAPQQTVTITPNVTKGATANTVTYTYLSSNPAVATVSTTQASNGAVVVTALAPGVTTITATAVGAGTGFSGANLTASATITVGSFPSGITTLNVQPAGPLNLSVGRTVGLTASVSQPTGAPAATITYTSSNPGVVSVSSAGLVTAITSGSANITVTATTAANSTFGASTLSQIVAVNVSPLANVSIQNILQGPTVSTGIDSAYSGLNATNSVAAGTGYVGPQIGVIAGIRQSLNPQVNQPIDVTNTKDQIEVLLNLQSNGQRVDSVVVYVDPATPTRRAAARQIFTNGDAGQAQTVTVDLFLLTQDFITDDATGLGTVFYQNGLKSISASVWTTLATGQTCPVTITTGNTCELQSATNARQNINFNNIDGFALKMTNPPNAQQDANNRTWWGGPNVSDIGQPSGLGSFQTYPVIYTPGRTIQFVSATFGNCLSFNFTTGTPGFVTDSAAPFIFQFGKSAPTTPIASSKFIACGGTNSTTPLLTPGAGVVGAYDSGDQFRFEDYPMVVASLDNSFNPGPRVLYAYNPTSGTEQLNNGTILAPINVLTGNFAGPRPTLFRSSPQLVNPNPIRIDYQNPTETLAVSQANGERWVNDAYKFTTGYTANDLITNGTGVGLFPTANRNTIFRVASANPLCGPQTFQDVPGALATATIAGVFSISPNTNRESPCDFTNNAFVAQASETDRLGNRAQIGNLQFTTTTNGVTTTTAASPLFGIDNTAPQASDAWDGSGPIPDMPNHYLATRDSIFQPVNGFVAATPFAIAPAANATDFYFGVRYTDTRSGFNQANHGTRIVRRFRPNATPLQSNRAVIDTVSLRTLTFNGGAGNPVENEDNRYRRDSVTIYGAGPLGCLAGAGIGCTLVASPPVGYYEYRMTLTDRAGNTSSVVEHAVIDKTSPLLTGTLIPPVIGASLTATAVAQVFQPTGVDDVEAVDFDLFLRYQALAMVGDSSNGSTVINGGARARFRRDKFTDVHSPWAVYNDTLLATPFGPTALLTNAGIVMPIATIRGIEPVDSTDAPIAYGQAGVNNPFNNGANGSSFKPNKLGAYGFDVRATHIGTGFPAPYAASLPFVNLGMTNLFPIAAPSGGEAAYTEDLFSGIVSNGTRWDAQDLNTATAGLDRLVGWYGQGNTSGTLQFVATTSTIVTQPPFPLVHLFKWEPDAQHTGSGVSSGSTTLNDSAAGQWIYIGTVNASGGTNPSLNDQGSTRFWTYFFSPSAFPSVTNGSIVQGGVTVGCYRAVGTNVQGDGITTRSFGSGCPAVVGPFANQISVVAGVVNPTITLRLYGNGSGSVSTDIAPAFGFTHTGISGGVDRLSQNRAPALHTFTFTPLNGATIDRAPLGCVNVLTAIGALPVTFPTLGAITCQLNVNAPTTVTVIFEGGTGL